MTKEQLAEAVADAHADFFSSLEGRRWPENEFRQLFVAVSAYVDATSADEMIHRKVASSINGLREYLQHRETLGRRVPGNALADADRLETMLFAGYDPSFEGHEPPEL